MKNLTIGACVKVFFVVRTALLAAAVAFISSASASAAGPGLRVSKVLPTGGVGHPFDKIEVTFSQAVQDGTFTAADAKLTGGSDILPTAVNKLASDRYEIVFPVTAVVNYGLVIGPNILDASGNAMDQNRNGVYGEASGDSYRGNLYAVPSLINTASADGQGIVAYGTTLTVDGAHAFESLFVLGGATVTHPAATANATSSLNLTVSGDVWIDGTSKIDASARGYIPGKTAGNVDAAGMAESGGSYGGRGLDDQGGVANPVYGDYRNPNELGTGGAGGGAGGGLVKISATAMQIEGAILANGQDAGSVPPYLGGGSGGGIRLDAATLSGNGTVSASGRGGYYGGSGGGGRVALYYSDASGFDLANKVTAHGGNGGAGPGAVGSVYLKKTGQEGELWFVSHGAAVGSWTPLGLPSETEFAAEKLIISGAGVIAKPEHQLGVAVNDLSLLNGAVLTTKTSDATTEYSLLVQVVRTLTVDGTSKIDVSARGYIAGKTVGNVDAAGMAESGGSYGGRGLDDQGGVANVVYGDYKNPNELGTGGASGGAGGGLVRISATAMQIEGAILANGQDAGSVSPYWGGGSGGAIRLDVATLSGNGTVSANGHAGYYGGSGGGGRVALYYSDASGFDLANKVMAHGGNGGAGPGAVGSVYLKKTSQEGELWFVSHGAATGSWTPLGLPSETGFAAEKLIISGAGVIAKPEHQLGIEANDLSLLNGAVLTTKASDATTEYSLLVQVFRTLTVDGTSKIDVSALGYIAGKTAGNADTAGMAESGGSYGGRGLDDQGGMANPVYGDYKNPNELGTGGASGGAGGGLVRISATAVQIEGAILANGQDAGSVSPYWGGGSGGGIRLDVATLSGNGTVSASGRAGYYGGSGGGGRVALYYSDASGFDLANKITAHGGNGGAGPGAVGSVYLKKTGQEGELWFVSHGAATGSWTPLGLPSETGFAAEKLIISGAGVIAKPEHQLGIEANDLSLVNGALLTTKATDSTNEYSLMVTVARTLTVDAASRIDVSQLGYSAGKTVGNFAGTGSGESGGSYGGRGGDDQGGFANLVYGDYKDPNELGSGGVGGGKGGGLAKISAATIQLDGVIQANGQNAGSATPYLGGGSGGGVRLDVGTLSGNGTVYANGGPGYYGGSGGGGRVAVYFTDASGFDLANKVTAHGGNGGAGAGAVGSIYLKKAGKEGELWLVSHGAVVGSWTPLGLPGESVFSAEKLIVSGSGVVVKPEHQMELRAGSFSLLGGAKLTSAATTAAKVAFIQLSVSGLFTLDKDSSVDVSALGFPAGVTAGTFAGPSGESGGSYGGAGFSDVGIANTVYGSDKDPNWPGTGGSGGGTGGGLIRITAGSAAISGKILANGQSGGSVSPYWGGGSGGGILINAGTITGNGTVQANGAPGYYGGSGGGGRVAVYSWTSNSLPSANLAAAGGAGGAGAGAVGSVVMSTTPYFGWQNPDALFHGKATTGWYAMGVNPSTIVAEFSAYRNGQPYVIASGAASAGSATWDTTSMPDGVVELRTVFRDASSKIVGEISESVLVNNAAKWHSGTLSGNETWAAGTVHIVEKPLVVPSGVTLTIDPGAVVKFAKGTGLTVLAGGIVNALGTVDIPIVLTALADDSAGGDTNLDGAKSRPVAGDWTGVGIVGNGQFNYVADIRYISQSHSGTLATSEAWMGTMSHIITSEVIVPPGVTLTINPGAAVKFAANARITVQGGGALVAEGASALPIIFTSIKDDSAGGDSNNDGDLTKPAAGDWVGINTSGTAALAHCNIRYGGNTGSGAYASGVIIVNGGNLSLSESVVETAKWDGVSVYSNGSATITNSVLCDLDRAIWVYSGGSVHLFNSTLDENTAGLVQHVGQGTIVADNCIIANSMQGSVTEGTCTLRYCDLWSSHAGSTNPDVIGKNGNISADPKFRDAAGGDYRLGFRSPAIDSADGATAPTLDLTGAPRYDDPRTPNTGIAMAGGTAVPDMGAYEFVEGATSDIDLIVTSISGPAQIEAGGEAIVQWQVRNVGTRVARAPWRDRIAMVAASPTRGSAVVALKEVATQTGIAPGATADFSAKVIVPGGSPGQWRWDLEANALGDVFEGTNAANNHSPDTAGFQLTLPALAIGAPATGSFGPDGDAKFYQVEQAAGQDLLIDLDAAAAAGRCRIYAGLNSMPTAQSFEWRSGNWNTPDSRLAIPAPDAARTVYVMLVAERIEGDNRGFQVALTAGGFGVNAVDLAEGSRLGTVTVRISGSGFEQGLVASLRAPGGALLTASSVKVESSTSALVTFDLTKGELANYDIVVSLGGTEASLAAAFTVNDKPAGHLAAFIFIPEKVRVGRAFQGIVEFSNDGHTDLPVPILVLGGGSNNPVWVGSEEDTSQTELQFLAAAPEAPSGGVLRPGEKHTIEFSSLTKVSSPQYTVSALDAGNPATVDWAVFRSALLPAQPHPLWNAAWNALVARSGTTYGQLISALVQASDERVGFGIPGREVRETLGYMLRREMYFLPGEIDTGHLMDLTGTVPLGDTNVRLRNTSTETEYLTNSWYDGRIVFRDVPGGDYAVIVNGHAASPSTVHLTGGAEDSIELRGAPGATVRGKVLMAAGGSAVAGAKVAVVAGDGGCYDTVTAADGTFEVGGLSAGLTSVAVTADGYPDVPIEWVSVDSGKVSDLLWRLEAGGEIAGRVVSPAGVAVAGASVVATDASGQNFRKAVSDAAGKFVVSGLGADTYRLVADATGFGAGQVAGIAVAAGKSASAGDVPLVAGGQVSGTVTSSQTGQPISGASVVFLGLDSVAGDIQTDAGGVYAVTDLAPGSASVRISAPGFAPAFLDVTISAGATAAASVALAPAPAISGTVTDATGAGLVDLEVTLYYADGNRKWVTTGADGAFAFDGIAPGDYSVVVRSATNAMLARRSVTLATSNATLGIVLPMSEIAGTFKDGAALIEGAVVLLQQGGKNLCETRTDASGKYRFFAATGATVDIVASAPGLAMAWASGLVVPADGSRLDVPPLVTGSQSIKLAVSSSAMGKAALEGATVAVVPSWSTGADAAAAGFAASDAAGNATVTRLQPGSYAVEVRCAGYAPVNMTVTAGANPAPVAVDMALGRAVTGTLRDASGYAVGGAFVLAYDPATKSGCSAVTSGTGQFLIDSLPAALLTVYAWDGVHAPVVMTGVDTRSLFSTPAAPVFAATGAKVEGGVDAGGGSVPGARVAVIAPDGSRLLSTSADYNGDYSLSPLAPGSYTLRVTIDGFAPVDSPLTVSGGGTMVHDISVSGTAGMAATVVAPTVKSLASKAASIRAVPAGSTSGSGWPSIPPGGLGDIRKGVGVPEDLYPPAGMRSDWQWDYLSIKTSSNPPCASFYAAQDACNYTSDQVYNAYSAWRDQASATRSINRINAGMAMCMVADIAGSTASLVVDAAGLLKGAGVLENGAGLTDEEIGKISLWLGGAISAGGQVYGYCRTGEWDKIGAAISGLAFPAFMLDGYLEKKLKMIPGFGRILAVIDLCKKINDTYQEFQAIYGDYLGGLSNLANAKYVYYQWAAMHKANHAYLAAAAGFCQNKTDKKLPPPPFVHKRPIGTATTRGLGSTDPNEKLTIGYGPSGWVVGQTLIPYDIHFENMATASAAAQQVTVTDQLDANLDWSTFELGEIQFGDVVVEVPPGLQKFEQEMDIEGDAYPVRVSASLDPDTGLVTWMIESFDPATGDLPEDPEAGFLPPNDSTGRGEGGVKYSIRLKAGLTTGTQILNKASIVFDVNDAIITNEVINSVDIVAPTSGVNSLGAFSLPEFALAWSGTDDGSGISLYDIYVSENGGAPTLWMAGTALQQSTFTGTRGSTYAFYSVATDNVGWAGIIPATAQTLTKVKSVSSAVGDLYETAKNTPLTVPVVTGVLANDVSPDKLALTAVIETNAAHGTLALNANGSLSYTPAKDFMGIDRFTYHVNDGMEHSVAAAVVLYVGPVPGIDVYGAPTTAVVATPFSYQIHAEGNPTSYAAAGLPKGLSVDKKTGKISGTPDEGGSFQVKLSAKNARGTGSATVPLTVTNPFVGLTGNYYALVDIDAVNHKLGGTLALTLTPSGAYTGKLQSGKLGYPIKGQLDSSGNGSVSAVLRKAPTLSGTIAIALAGNSTGTLTGAIPAGTGNIQGELVRKVPKVPGSALCGYYTMLIEAAPADVGAATKPQGSGFAVLTIDKTAGAKFSGHLADGSVFTWSGPLWAGGEVPVYALLAGGNSAALGSPLVEQSGITGTIDWVKLPAAGTIYPAGFSMTLDVKGSLWSAPAGTNVLTGAAGATAFTLTLDPDASVLKAAIDQAGQWPDTNKPALSAPVAPGVGFSFSPKTGAFSGKVPVDAAGKTKPAKFQGVLLRNPLPAAGGTTVHGAGFLLGAESSAPVWLTTP